MDRYARDKIWYNIEKCWKILGGWTEDDEKRYGDYQRQIQRIRLERKLKRKESGDRG